MMVRFFGGWDFTAADAQSRLPANAGYAKGVPMGGDLQTAPAGKAPTFLVAAMKDPYSGNLDRIQIVKGWVDAKGARQEKVYDVAWGGDRKPGADGKLPAVGNTVDVANATWTNTIGASELITVWKDPSFDPALRAVYYARVIEIPTPRWTAYDAKYFGTKMPPESSDDHAGAGLHLADLVHAVASNEFVGPGATMKSHRASRYHLVAAAAFGIVAGSCSEPQPETMTATHAPAGHAPPTVGAPHWEYEGTAGPEAWGALSPDFATCSAGRLQSPIDFAGASPSATGELRAAFPPAQLEIRPAARPGNAVHNGHTIQVDFPKGDTLSVGGVPFELVQFHFHAPSEHTVAGRHLPMEIHFVHRSAAGTLAVLGVLVEQGAANASFEAIQSALPKSEGSTEPARPGRGGSRRPPSDDARDLSVRRLAHHAALLRASELARDDGGDPALRRADCDRLRGAPGQQPPGSGAERPRGRHGRARGGCLDELEASGSGQPNPASRSLHGPFPVPQLGPFPLRQNRSASCRADRELAVSRWLPARSADRCAQPVWSNAAQSTRAAACSLQSGRIGAPGTGRS